MLMPLQYQIYFTQNNLCCPKELNQREGLLQMKLNIIVHLIYVVFESLKNFSSIYLHSYISFNKFLLQPIGPLW